MEPHGIGFRALARPDLALVRAWLNTPHVYEWWGRDSGAGSLGGPGGQAASVSEVEAKYGPTIDRGGTTHRFVIKGNGAAIGLIQWYRLRDFPDYAIAIGEDPDRGAGMDLFIGDPNAIGRGIGSEAIRRFADSMVPRSDGMDRVVSGPARDNLRSIRAFEKAGFQHVRDALVPGERVPEAIMVLDRRPAKIR